MAEEEKQKEDTDNDKGVGVEKKGDFLEKLSALLSTEGIIMILVAVIADVINFVPIVSIVTNIVMGLFFGLWVLITGRYKNILGKMIGTYLISFILGLIPIVSDITPFISWLGLGFGQAWPASWTGWVFWVFKNSKG